MVIFGQHIHVTCWAQLTSPCHSFSCSQHNAVLIWGGLTPALGAARVMENSDGNRISDHKTPPREGAQSFLIPRSLLDSKATKQTRGVNQHGALWFIYTGHISTRGEGNQMCHFMGSRLSTALWLPLKPSPHWASPTLPPKLTPIHRSWLSHKMIHCYPLVKAYFLALGCFS